MKRSRVIAVTISLLCIIGVTSFAASKDSPKRESSKPSSSSPTKSSGGYTKASSSKSSPAANRPSAEKLYNKSSSPKTTSTYTSTPKPKETTPAPKKVTSSGGYSSAASEPRKATSTPVTAQAKGNRFDEDASRQLKMQKAASSLKAYEDNQAKFEKPKVNVTPKVPAAQTTSPKTASPPPPTPKQKPAAQTSTASTSYQSNPVYRDTTTYAKVPFDDVSERRRRSYNDWTPPTRVVYQSAPSYGSWDSMFLWWMLWNDDSFGFHHQNDRDYQRWHSDAVKLAEQNGELKAQLARHDAQILALQQRKLAQDEKYLPREVRQDPLVALSDDAIETLPVQKPVLRIATGVEGGSYARIAAALKRKAPRNFQVELIPTSGAAENWNLLQKGNVDAAIVQSDTDIVMKQLVSKEHAVADTSSSNTMHEATIYSEYVMLLVAKDSPIQSVKDLGKDTTIYVGPDGSGSAITWRGFLLRDPGYKNVKVANTDYRVALSQLKGEKNSAMMFVAGSETPLLKTAGKSGNFRLVPVDDADFLEVNNECGNPVYDSLLISSDAYPGLHTKPLQTLAVDAVWTLSDAWIAKYGAPAFDEVNYAVIGVISDLHIKKSLEATDWSGVRKVFTIAGASILIIVALILFVTKVNVTGGRA